jgi:integrase
MALNHLQITRLSPAEKPYKVSDGGALYLIVQTTGAMLWRMNFKHRGRQRTLHFGRWPDLSIAAARRLRDDARAKLAEGVDPIEAASEAERQARLSQSSTFRIVAEEWVAKNEREGISPVTLDKIRWLLSKAYPALGHKALADITPFETLSVLRKVEMQGHYESARRMRSVLSRIFRYGIATARAEKDPAADLRGALTTPKVRHRAAITDPKEVGKLLHKIDGYGGRGTTVYALRLMSHLFVRPIELRTAEWAEFDFDEAVWSIPAAKMKMRRPHRVPLSRQALELLQEVKTLTGHRQHVFPALGAPKRPMCENTLNAALRRLGYTEDEMTAHGFRAMAATLLNEMGCWNADAIERQLAHMDSNQVRAAYARGQYWDERVRMMQFWSDHLDQLKAAAGRSASAVAKAA